MKNRKTVAIIVIAVAILLIGIIGATFAYFSAVITENNKTETRLHASELGIIFDGTQEILAESIEPGWSAEKKFTVENTSDYDMSFDINFTKVVNNFTRTNDLAAIGSAVFVDDDHINDTVQMLGLNETNVGSGAKTNFELPNENSYTLPVDGSVDTSTTPATITYGTGVFKVARVFIPAHSKQEFTILFSYIYLAPTPGYTVGDPEDPNNQNVDQGKIFRTTIEINANGIDPGTNEDPVATDPNDGDPADAWKPTSYSFPYEAVTADYASLDKPVFLATDENGNKGVCIIKEGKKYCFKAGNTDYELEHMATVFGAGACNDDSLIMRDCYAEDFTCRVYYDEHGDIYCRYEPIGMACSVAYDSSEECYW